MNINEQIKQLPDLLQPAVDRQWQSFIKSDADISALPSEVAESLAKVWACSEFVMQTCVRFPKIFLELASSGDLLKSYTDTQYKTSIIIDLKHNEDAALSRQLRLFRRREMLRIVWRDIAGWSELVETTRDLSHMAEACIDYALSNLYQWQCDDLGTPCNAEGVSQKLVVLGMGKLGAWELNVSSDIDLIFAFSDDGEVQGGPKPLTNSEFFSRLGKKLIQSLDQQTADGFVFRVDMRLRPFGQTGPLVSSFSSFENYYLVHGRSWERYAMVKVRVVGGDYKEGEVLLTMLRPFVYRRYLDYGAYESLRELKAMIVQEVKRKGMKNNVKLGAGGIREVEFIAQVFQLIRGGRNTALQERRVLVVLDFLAKNNLLPEFVVKELKIAYTFLRNTEHRIQEYQDRQTHNLPEDEIGQARLALGMGFENWPSFLTELNQHRENVEAHFDQVFVAPQTEESEATVVSKQQTEIQRLEALWYNKLDEEESVELLSRYGFSDSSEALQKLQTLHSSRQYSSLSRQGQTRLDRLMPLLLGALQQVDNIDITFDRILLLLTNVARRSVYLALLLENPMVLSQLIKLCSASPWIARYLQQLPILLDELMDPRSLYKPPEKSELENDLRQRLSQIDLDDVEQGMDVLRHFKQSNVLRVAAADIVDALPLMKVSDHLSWIAETILDEALEQAWHHLVTRHGRPVCQLDEQGEGQLCDKGFAIVGYGKLGGLELGYGSDLDMVFLHGSESNNLTTLVDENSSDERNGKKSIAVPVFFARLGQRIIHLLTSHTSAGVLYEADMRLRPDGASGLLVTNLKSYRDYQLKKAWLWEHQALVRARVVAGDPVIAEKFAAIRREVLSQQRDRTVLRQEVIDMRNRMRKELSKDKEGQFDLKQGVGGIVDIEFMVQYGVLAWAHEKPDLLEYTDNIRLLAGLAAAGLMAKADVEVLSDAYRTFRARLHKMALQEQPGLVDAEEYSDLSASVQRIWQNWLENE
ncbi:MAG: bifunctional [glutamate--ammonia ligase]-adenylyl-L-tyrosine phosphorylase/[glutamate--ammonia-ligase] adenylyltransferase [Gammaproteobacteria bacterium]|nr:bifunctional [glutamate--ammonia ligase]-adenylyl-L-tyrosine phosphorylase/[glutamate--ammonia-ligase] adenylyltransferase [Gammaproteobacteria bacterium]MCW8987313.1 bifunctional [glutamate--ammonia ligase]-adenylyl-L-tyrosine phosphorylase/[glutamate--ammonia-ligase] adenylyltransferase [Gammaproteobacteria bacterium]